MWWCNDGVHYGGGGGLGVCGGFSQLLCGWRFLGTSVLDEFHVRCSVALDGLDVNAVDTLDVRREIAPLGEGVGTQVTREWFLSRVASHV